MDWPTYSAIALGAYLLGSIPTGFLFGKARGMDIRQAGSGNIGATNVFRLLGKTAGITVLLIDALKGFIACALLPGWFTSNPTSLHAMIGGLCSILGHNFTCWLRFKGGKGIATSAGVLVGLMPIAFGVVLGVWALVFAISRYVSLASILAAFVLPFAAWGAGAERPLLILAIVLSVLAIYKHRSNIERLLKGTEHRFGKARSKEASPPSSSP